MYLCGNVYDDEAAERVLLELKRGGFTGEDLALFSNQPVELRKGVLDRRSKMSLVVVASAVTFLLSTILFVGFTQYDYRLVTGGMPLFSFWATGVVFYELTMLGAILSTFCWFLWESGIARRNRAPVPDTGDGAICVRVRCSPEQEDIVLRQLRSAGASDVRSLEEAK